MTDNFNLERPLDGMAIAETIRYAHENWATELRWNSPLQNTELESAIGFALKQMVETGREYFTLTSGQRHTNTSDCLETLGWVRFATHEGKYYATLTTKAIAAVAKLTIQKRNAESSSNLPEPPVSLVEYAKLAL